MLENKQGMVGKYKQLNQTHKKTLAENAELAAELARLKAAGGNSQNDQQMTALKSQNQQLQGQIEALKRVSQTENQKLAKNASSELAQKIAFLEQQNDKMMKENANLRQA